MTGWKACPTWVLLELHIQARIASCVNFAPLVNTNSTWGRDHCLFQISDLKSRAVKFCRSKLIHYPRTITKKRRRTHERPPPGRIRCRVPETEPGTPCRRNTNLRRCRRAGRKRCPREGEEDARAVSDVDPHQQVRRSTGTTAIHIAALNRKRPAIQTRNERVQI